MTLFRSLLIFALTLLALVQHVASAEGATRGLAQECLTSVSDPVLSDKVIANLGRVFSNSHVYPKHRQKYRFRVARPILLDRGGIVYFQNKRPINGVDGYTHPSLIDDDRPHCQIAIAHPTSASLTSFDDLTITRPPTNLDEGLTSPPRYDYHFEFSVRNGDSITCWKKHGALTLDDISGIFGEYLIFERADKNFSE